MLTGSFTMNIKHITSESLRRLLTLTEKKDQLIKAVTDVENEIANALSGAATTVSDFVEVLAPGKATTKNSKPAAAKSAKKKRQISPESRAKMAAAAKARWASKRSGKKA